MLKNFLIAVLFVFVCSFCKGQVVITKSTERVLAGKELFTLQPNKEIGFKEVLHSSDFVPSTVTVPNFGLSKSSIWLKFSISNQSSDNHLVLHIAYPELDKVELFSPGKNGDYEHISSGKDVFFNTRKYKSPDYLFDLNVPVNTTKIFFLKIRGDKQIFLPIYVSRPTAQFQQSSKENMLSGIYIGIVLIMLFYNLFVYFSVQDRSYLYYVIYIFFVGLTQVGLKGYNFQYLWPAWPGFDSKSIILFASTSGFAALLFTNNYLEVGKNFRRARPALWLCMGLFILSFVPTLAGNIPLGFKIMQSATSLASIVIFVTSLTIMIKGYQPAKFFFSAWSVLLAGAIIFLLKDYQILPYNTLTSYAMQLASAIEMSLLSFGLADRINILKKEKEFSQAEALRVAKENERIIREQNVILEQKVNERTLELKESNDELNVTLEDLKQAQSQLVESEKMASLGQLTAGIAHEINNPINFVTSNVTPLRRDFDLLIEALSSIEDIALSEETSTTDKQKSIENIKEELDFDYLKIEISHLLKGIHEGATRTAEIVKGLRIFSRVDEDDLKRADVTAGLESTLVIVNNLLNNRIRVIKEYDSVPPIECYPGKLNQVFLNILSNAIHAVNKKFGEKPGGELKISTSFNEENVFIKIADNGTGMDENTRKKIFEPFFTTKDVGEGTGLGMSIAFNTINKHRGQILIESTPGEGTEFTLQLPIIHKL